MAEDGDLKSEDLAASTTPRAVPDSPDINDNGTTSVGGADNSSIENDYGGGANFDKEADGRTDRYKSDEDDGSVEEIEDEDDEAEDEEESDDSGRPRHKRRKTRRNQFIDVEAEVDDEEEDVSDEAEGLAQDDGFIQEPEGAEDLDSATHRIHRQVDRHREDFTERDAVELADQFREKYGHTSAPKYRGDNAVIPQRLLLPSVHDPSIFGINCRIGREKEAVRAILRKKLSLQYTSTPLDIFSAFQRDAFPGRIYIEAKNQKSAVNACKGLPNLYPQSKILLVPIKEYPDMFRVRKNQEHELVPGTYVRVKRGKYADDLALVENLSENGLEVQLKLIPRLDYGRAPVIDSNDLSKRKRSGASQRPAPKLFSPQDAQQHDSRSFQRRGANSYFYAGDIYERGFLIKDFKLAYISTEAVNPTLDEIAALNSDHNRGIDLQSLSDTLRKDMRQQLFQPGEHVEVAQGEQTGLRGVVVAFRDDIVTIKGSGAEFEGVEVEVPAGHLRKHFDVGDHVRVVNGNHKDDTGMVVSCDKDEVTLLTDVSQTEIRVFSHDLKMTKDIGGTNAVGEYSLHDLVQINPHTVGCIVDVERDYVKVLAQDGQTVKISPGSIIMKVSNPRALTTDQFGRQISVGDTVRETSGERRQGSLLHIFHQYLFIHNREIQENLGVFVNLSSNVTAVVTKSGREEKRLDLSSMNPAAATAAAMIMPRSNQGGNTRILVNKRVAIGAGSHYKGLRGLVRDVTSTTATVELDARNTVVTVDVQKLLVQSGDNFIPFRQFASFKGGRNGPPQRSSAPPKPAGSQTPAWASGGKTPAWGGSRTPAWASNSGAKTPVWGSRAVGGNATPAWNSGARTPAWNSGARTPAWNSGSKTPAWNSDGGRTPAWNADGGRTPAWSASSSWDSNRVAPTPAAPTPGAPTPGFYDSIPTPAPLSATTPGPLSAPTPGVYPATPGVAPTPAPAWGDGDDDAPQYED